ncbi:MAG: hypothetical protein ABIG95_00795 [Candidatus Woesearchaeota archaeon]
MQLTKAELLEWASIYIKHRDLVLRRIKDIQVKPDQLIVAYKDDTVEIVLADPSMQNCQPVKEKTTFITINTKPNLAILFQNWKTYSQIKELTIIFINPNSELDTKWIIRPYIHSRICDEASLKTGLKAMFETVEALQ